MGLAPAHPGYALGREQRRFLLRDRDASFGKGFVRRARAIGIESVLSPFRFPQTIGVAERMVTTPGCAACASGQSPGATDGAAG
ncbi:MAG: hypothetical protein ABIP13_10765 [Tepidiformaceae bacterium]